MAPNEPTAKRSRYRINRRRLLQFAGVGVGSLTMTTIGGGIARAENTCAEGPFERTYSAETVNISKISHERRDHGEAKEYPSAVEGAMEEDEIHRGSGSAPAASGAQRPPRSDDLLTVVTKYEGVRDTALVEPPLQDPPIVAPSDSQIALGQSKAIQAINQKLAVFNQRSGTLEHQVPFEHLFDPVITEETFVTGRPILFDPRLRYDPNAGRFVVGIFYMYFPTWSGSWLVAASNGPNPNGTWNLFRIPTFSGDWPDYPTLGLDRDAIYLAAETLPQSSSLPDIEVAILDKNAVYNGVDVSVNHFTGLLLGPGTDPVPDIQLVVQPAFQPYSGGQSGTYYLMSSQTQNQVFFNEPDTGLTLWKVTDPLDNPSLTCSVLEVEPFSGLAGTDPQDIGVRQPNTDLRISIVGDRLMNLDFNDGSLWTAHATRYNWEDTTDEDVTAIRWYEIDPTTPEVLQSGTYGEPGTSYFLPHINSNGDRTLVTYNVSGPKRFPSIEVAGRTSDSTQGQMEAATVIQEGESSMIHPTKFGRRGEEDAVWWGDYMGISVHPTTGRFWVTGQYSPDFDVPLDGADPDRYQTKIAEVTFDGGNGER